MECVEFIDLDNNRSGIYCIFNMRNGKLYIGSAKNLSDRTRRHIKGLMNRNHINKYLQNAWNKDGIISFLFIVIEYCEVENLINREQYWLTQFDFNNQLYNICPIAGSTIGRKHTEDSKQKMRVKASGRKLSEEHKRKIGFSGMGKIISEETRRKMSESKRNMSEEISKKMSKPVNQIDINSGEILATFNSGKEAARTFGRSKSSISEACSGKQKTAYGYKWQFATN